MRIKEAKVQQSQRLEEICKDKGVDFDSIAVLLESVKTKKMQKKRNYHSQTIVDVIEKGVK